MRSILLLCTLLLLPSQAWALCRCTCVRGVMRPICQQTDLVEPICQGFCETQIRPERVVTPLAGGKQVFEPAQPTNPAPGGLASPDLDLNSNPNGTQLGTPSQLSGSVDSALSAGGGR